MLEDIINKGVLEMSGKPFETAAQAVSWSGYLSVRILVVVSVVLFLVMAMDIVTVLPYIIDCLIRPKANSSLEHSISIARIRNEVAALMFIPFCLLADRFSMYCPPFIDDVRPDLKVLCAMGLLAAYLLVRLLCFTFFRPKKLSLEAQATVKHIPLNFFIALVPVLLASSGIMCLFHAPDALVKPVLLWETALFYFFSLVRICQFLSPKCTFFTTFLYLCALEFLPTGLLIAGEFIP